MNFPPRAISVLLLVQCLFIGMGCAIARKMLRVLVQTESPLLLADAVPNTAVFVFRTGFWAFLIPLLWAVWVSLRSESHQGIPWTQFVDAKVTILLTMMVVCIWSYGAMQAMDAVFSYHGPMTVISQQD